MAHAPDVPNALYEELKRLARLRDTASYKEFTSRCGLDNQDRYYRALSKMLDAINEKELARGAPLLSAVVINKKRNRPGSKFFKEAHELGRFRGDDEWKYWEQERDRLAEYWSRHF